MVPSTRLLYCWANLGDSTCELELEADLKKKKKHVNKNPKKKKKPPFEKFSKKIRG